MIGKLVILRTINDEPRLAVVLEVKGGTVFVVGENEYKKINDGYEPTFPIGFRKIDVFICEDDVELTIRNLKEGEKFTDWEKLTKYN